VKAAAHKVGHVARLAHASARMIDLIDMSLAAQDAGISMGRQEMFEAFGDFDPSEHDDEVKDLWGETHAYEESARRTRRYAKEDWARFTAESDAVIDAWFYPCSQEMHARLGQMYVADPRLAATGERIHPGMAQYVCDAIIANAARAAGEPARPGESGPPAAAS
jgi:MerR family transcriptional regulator, thiopeptide resistance regulator